MDQMHTLAISEAFHADHLPGPPPLEVFFTSACTHSLALIIIHSMYCRAIYVPLRAPYYA